MYNETDQLNFTLSIDNYVADGLKTLAPHKSVFDLNTPKKVSSNLNMPKTVIGTIGHFLKTPEIPDPIKLQHMEALFNN